MGPSVIPGLPPVRPGRIVVGMAAATILVVAVAVAAVRPDHLAGSPREDPALAHRNGTTPVTTRVTGRSGPVTVTGVIDRVEVVGVRLESARTPLTVTPVGRSDSNGATIVDALVDGHRASLAWDARQPLVLQGAGGLRLSGISGSGDRHGWTMQLGGAMGRFVAGHYHVATPVGVGTEQIAEPRDSVDFTADSRTEIAFQGADTVRLAYPIQVQGPGRATLSGRLEAQDARGTRTARAIEFAGGPFTLTLTASPAGVSVRATAQGKVSAR